MLRILIVEDEMERISRIEKMLPEDFRIVLATSAGRAIGLFERDGRSYHCIMLDHDIQSQAVVQSDRSLSASHILPCIIQHVSRDTPILIHSTNSEAAPRMFAVLRENGFTEVTRQSFNVLTREKFETWLGLVRDLSE